MPFRLNPRTHPVCARSLARLKWIHEADEFLSRDAAYRAGRLDPDLSDLHGAVRLATAQRLESAMTALAFARGDRDDPLGADATRAQWNALAEETCARFAALQAIRRVGAVRVSAARVVPARPTPRPPSATGRYFTNGRV